jgi:hypothetical protein
LELDLSAQVEITSEDAEEIAPAKEELLKAKAKLKGLNATNGSLGGKEVDQYPDRGL